MMDMQQTMIETLRHNPTLVLSIRAKAAEIGIENGVFFAAWYADDTTDPTLRVWPSGLKGDMLGSQYNQYRPLIRQGMCMALIIDDSAFTRVRITRHGTIKPAARHEFVTEAVG